MVTHVTSAPSSPAVVDHISCPYTPEVEKIFFHQIKRDGYDISYKGKKVVRQTISIEDRKYLAPKGFGFTKSRKTDLKAKRRIFEIDIGVQKNYDDGKIKELVISVPSSSQEERLEKRKTIVSGIKAIIPDIDVKVATSDKFVRC